MRRACPARVAAIRAGAGRWPLLACSAACSERRCKAERIKLGCAFQVAVITTRCAGLTIVTIEPPPMAAPAVLAGASTLRLVAETCAPRASGSSRIASVRPIAAAGQFSLAPGVPRYTAWRLKRKHVSGAVARS